MLGRLPRLLLALAGLSAAVGSLACGGRSEDELRALVDRAFNRPIHSADVTVAAEVRGRGAPQLERPLSVRITGPYRTGGPGRIPSLDWDLSFSGQGQTFTAGLISTGDNAFVSFQNTDYEVGRKAVHGVNRRFAEQRGQNRTLRGLGIDPRNWLRGLEEEGDEDVAGVGTTHVSAAVDVPRLLDDLNVFAQRAPRPGAGPPPTLTEEEKRQVTELVRDARLDVYVGKDDELVRRLAGEVRFAIPPERRASAGGLQDGAVSFSFEFANLGGNQRIVAPPNARPIAELQRQLGQLGGLGGGARGGGTRGGGARDAVPRAGASR